MSALVSAPPVSSIARVLPSVATIDQHAGCRVPPLKWPCCILSQQLLVLLAFRLPALWSLHKPCWGCSGVDEEQEQEQGMAA